MRARVMLVGALVAAIATAAPRLASAQAVDVPAMIKLIDTQPADMDRSVWREKRRDAARKLAASKDKRAVVELMKLAETETFDIIGEIAIEGLGAAGDPQAVPTLQKIAADVARDKGQRELARKALGKLGAKADAPADKPIDKPTGDRAIDRVGDKPIDKPGDKPADKPADKPGDKPTDKLADKPIDNPASGGADLGASSTGSATTPPPPTDSGSALLGGGKSSTEIPTGPDLPADTLAAYERLTIAGGTASLGYNTAQKRIDFDADVSGLYQKRIERESMAWGWDGAASVVTGYIDPVGSRAVTRGAQVDLSADGEVRLYAGKLYGVGKAVGSAQMNYTADIDAMNPAADIKSTSFSGDAQVAIGGGWGRVLDIGAAIRVRRLARTLDAARALGKPIDAATSRKLQLAWWALRGERTTYRALLATIAVLREAGILLGEPDASLAYEILNVLRDTQLYLRPDGLDLQLAFGEGYLDNTGDPTIISGRNEQLLAAANYGTQLDNDTLELNGQAYGRLRVFAGNGQPSPWAAGVTGQIRKFTYTDHGDPVGALDLTANIAISDDDVMGTDYGMSVGAQLGWTWWINQASGVRLAANISEDSGVFFLGANASATYGFLDGTFAH